MEIKMYDHQMKAIEELSNGSILCGGTGSGKSRTALAFYICSNGGSLKYYVKSRSLPKLYIITTARKRDELEWEGELTPFLINPEEVVIDSWNNIKKYVDVKDAFFIFDEQRVVGSGAWVKAFYKITKNNNWILLSATPGDTWIDYIPVFVANGFYKNKTDFINQHVIYDYRSKFPKVDRYINTGRLIRLRNRVLVDMIFERHTVQHHEDVYVDYDIPSYKRLFKERWNYSKEAPIETASELCYELRKIVNSSDDRLIKLFDIFEMKGRIIVFYNYDYELELIKNVKWPSNCIVAEWNGHKHEPVPNDKDKDWIYLVQYNAGCEAWNCIRTDTIVFFSQNYSYKMMVQAAGRIDRLNSPFCDLYYYHLKTRSGIDLAISKAIKNKKKFNESRFCS